MTYQEALAYLDNLQFHKIKLGLGAMRSFLERIGRPELQLKIVHVAGTNGKGSVSASLLTVMQYAGLRVGLYTSPHLSCVRERFRINDTYISEDEFAATAERIIEVLGDETITYFEFTTAMAFLWFAEANLDLVVLETGLGGRLDATNVVTPMLSIITSISMDHEAYLGNTLTEVAGEKAGIIKSAIPVVATGGEPEVIRVLEQVAGEHKAPLYLLGRDFDYDGTSNADWNWVGYHRDIEERVGNLRCSMKGAYQRENGSLVIAALKLLGRLGLVVAEADVRSGLASVVWPGRLEYLVLDRKTRRPVAGATDADANTVCYLLDGAHNPAGVKNLALTLENEYSYRKLIVVWGAMIDKDIIGGLARMMPMADSIILTRPEGERSAEPEQLLACLSASDQGKAVCLREVSDAVRAAEDMAAPGDMIVVAGSLYLLGAVRALLVGELVES